MARLLGGAVILAVLVAQLGAGPFVDGVRRVDAATVAVAVVMTAATTWCCAWRWSVLSARLDVPVPLRTAYRLYYRSQLLNSVLPGGVLGDVHRGVDHGRNAGSWGRGLRSVLWDRGAGQGVQSALALAALALLPDAARPAAGWLLLSLAVVCAVALAVAGAVAPPRLRRATVEELRRVLGAGVAARVVAASTLAALGHAVVLVTVARAAGVDVGLTELGALAVVVLLASSLPLNVAGWGPREGAAAWLFGAAGLGAATGVGVAVCYGVVSLVATLPGVLTLLPTQAGARPVRPEVATRG